VITSVLRGRPRARGLAAVVAAACPARQIGQASLNPFGAITNPASGNVLTDPDPSTVSGTQLLMEPGQGDQSEPWHVSFYHQLGH
jgi:hypothetical protein